VIDADWEIFTAQKHNDLLNSFTNETSNISSAMTIFPTIVSIVITAITQLSIAFALNIPLTLIVLVFGSIFFLIFKKYFAIAKLNGERMRIANRQYLDEIKNQLDSIKEIKSYGVEEFHKKLLHDVLDEYETASIRRTKMATLPTLLFSMSSTILITIIFYIANVILQVEIMELILIVYIFARIWPIFSRLHKEMFSLNNAIPSFENVDRMLRTLNATSAEKEASEGHIDIKREIAFDSVSFAYSGTTEKILDTTTFSIKAHTITALKGESGVGKSTIVDLLMGLLRPSEGRILFDDTVLDHQNIRAWRRSIGYMPQDPIILNKSIRENITRFNPHVSEEEIILALKNSQAFDFVQKLPDGLDTLMGNKGIRLSGGEKQRIALARVLVSSPSILILDEATSALDNENDRKIQEIIQSLKQSMTIVIVAHRISTIESADHVMNVKNGQVYSV
jgi:ABC-type multidrug transport system fused ATPase/permease subunit